MTTYTELNNDDTLDIQRKNNILCKELPDQNNIDRETYKSIICHNGIITRIYGLIKIHKPDKFLRSVVSTQGTPSHNFVVFLTIIRQHQRLLYFCTRCKNILYSQLQRFQTLLL